MARVTSIYKALKYVVMCQPAGQAFFEPIAAFNSDVIAIDYAKGCAEFKIKAVMLGWRYRVEERKNNEPKCLYRSDEPTREVKTVGFVFCRNCHDQNACVNDRSCFITGAKQ